MQTTDLRWFELVVKLHWWKRAATHSSVRGGVCVCVRGREGNGRESNTSSCSEVLYCCFAEVTVVVVVVAGDRLQVCIGLHRKCRRLFFSQHLLLVFLL